MKDEDKTKEQLIFELMTLRKLLHQLTRLDKVQSQSQCLPICADCKKIRDEQGLWQQVELYLHRHYGIDFTHGFCPDCLALRHLEIENFLAAPQNV